MINAIIQQGMGLVQYQIDRGRFSNATYAKKGELVPKRGEAPGRCATLPVTSVTGPVRRNTTSEAVATPTESGVLLCPNSGAGRGLSTSMLHGFGLGASVRKAGGAASDAFLTPSPSDARRNANDGFPTPEGAETMTTVNTTSTGAKPTLPTHPPKTITRKPWPFIAQGDVLTQAQRLRAAARHALRAAALLEQINAEGGV